MSPANCSLQAKPLIDVHRYNYGDITWWDHLFGTFREADDFAPACGFPDGHEKDLGRMLAFRNNY